MSYQVNKHKSGIDEIIINNGNLRISLLNIGASIHKISTQDKNGKLENICLSYLDIDDYITNDIFLGTTVGRVAGRIANGKFSINGNNYSLKRNNGTNNLHSEPNGFNHVFFKYNIAEDNDKTVVTFFENITSIGTDDFPGNLNVEIIYEIFNDNITVTFNAVADKDTLCNITNHSYFNLSGNIKENIYNHQLKADFECMYSLSENQLPMEEVMSDLIDFKSGKNLGTILKSDLNHFISTRGIDHPFKFNQKQLQLSSSTSGRVLTVNTSYPIVVLYTQNWESKLLLEKNTNDNYHLAIAIEPQFLPNDINISGDKSQTILLKNKKYSDWISYKFETKGGL